MLLFNSIFLSKGQKALLKNVSGFVGPNGGLVGLIGPNGSGKTTLLKILSGLMPADAGEVFLCSKEIQTLAVAALPKYRGYLAADRYCAWDLPVEDVVRLGAPSTDSLQDILEKTGTWDLRRRAIHTLSSGEIARVLLARALASDAPILFLDEPIANLDPRYQLIIMKLLKEHAGRGKLIVSTFHELGLVRKYCDFTWMMKDGVMTASGPTIQTFQSENLQACFDLSKDDLSFFLHADAKEPLEIAQHKNTEDDAIDGKGGKGSLL